MNIVKNAKKKEDIVHIKFKKKLMIKKNKNM